MDDAFFIAGVALYWGEASKTRSDLSLANANPRARVGSSIGRGSTTTRQQS